MRKLRGPVDTVGFAHRAQQIEAIVERIAAKDGARLGRTLADRHIAADDRWRIAIAPHDDYAYVGYLYPLVLGNVRAATVIVLGVAHKARALGLEDRLVFDSFTHWTGPYGDIAVSPLRQRIVALLPEDAHCVHDEMQRIEHSIEAKLPFLQQRNRDLQIVPILVPAMSFVRMNAVGAALARALAVVMEEDELEWGSDVAVIASTDAVHYGDEGWSGRSLALCGTGAEAYAKALAHEHRIIADCFEGALSPERIEQFTRYTLSEHDHREYKWTWCGRYSVPLGLLVAWHLQQLRRDSPLVGTVLGYATSLDDQRIEVGDLDGMGVTAPATPRHWVGYAAVGFR